jgi:uncharacterized protein (DUF433 family)
MNRKKIVALFVVLALGGPSVALAGQQTLEFNLLVKTTGDEHSINVPHLENQTIGQGKAFGVAIFKDGRIAVKDFVYQYDANKNGTANSNDYSTYTFDDGSTITARFVDSDAPGRPELGEYKILSGTGTYAGATGTGTYEGLKSPFKGAELSTSNCS